MDLVVYGQVLWRFRWLMVFGTLLAVALSFLSYYNVTPEGKVAPRKPELWRAESTLFLTQPGFPAGRTEQPLVLRNVGGEETPVPKYAEPGRFAGLAALYARLANSDAVRQRVERDGGRLRGAYQVVPTADTTYGAASPLPMITVLGMAPTEPEALQVTARATKTFLAYFAEEQDAARIPADQRVRLTVLNAAGATVLLDPRKKTLPIVVLLAVIFATIALAFVLENARPSRTVLAPAEDEDVPSPDVRRLA
jgi:hypothetical protein